LPGITGTTRRGTSIASWACNCATMLKRRVKAELCDGHKPATRSNGTSWQRLRVLTILDIFSRFSPALKPRFSSRRSDVVAIMEGVCNEVGIPATIRVDQGSEFVSRDLDL
jgi:putative transposase